jgi:YfiH family protein
MSSSYAGPANLPSMAILRASMLDEIPFIEHGFGTRVDGTWPDSTTCTTIHQVHSDIVLEAREPGLAGEGDALVTDRAGLFVSIRTADCVPILIADPERRVVAAVHAGWRGTAVGILSRTVEKMAQCYGSRPTDLRLAFGPAIGSCCYEVGPEVAARFQKEGRQYLDLIGENRRLAVEAGVRLDRMESLNLCTKCNAGQFFSFRREQAAAGRMTSAIRVRPETR